MAPSQPPSAYLRRFFYDTILHHPTALRYLRDLVGSDRLRLGTDAPFPLADRSALNLVEQAGCTAHAIAQIGGGTAPRRSKR